MILYMQFLMDFGKCEKMNRKSQFLPCLPSSSSIIHFNVYYIKFKRAFQFKHIYILIKRPYIFFSIFFSAQHQKDKEQYAKE